ncbi:Cell wall integrity and stress response component 4-like protein [Elsinoe fawcettii]|nr:Cell wall integrity and stress response component 4-like protein [Elsinoe fawcettii]
MAGYSISSSSWGLLLLALFTIGGQAQLSQTYCSNQNTGASNPPNFSIYQSNGLCFDTCKDQYAFAVVQYQNCWCSNFIPSNQLESGECSQQCPGFPREQCGNQDDGLFGYIALSRAPSGTAGASPTQTRTQTRGPSRPTTSDPPSSSAEEPSTTAPPSTTEASPSPSTTDPLPPSPPSSTITSSSLSESPSTVTSIVTLTSASSSSTISSTESEAPVTSTQVVTVSGAIVTQTVTSTPRPRVTGTASDNLQEIPSQSNTPTGVIVGAVIGSLAAVAFILLALFLLWRRRRAEQRKSGTNGINRNASVLSKAGLLSTAGRTNDAEKSMEEPRYGSQRQSALYDPPESPISAPGGVYETSSHPSRRNSRPLVYDQRLNPAAIMQDWEGNGSRTSIGTMQDQRDYSRPLGITNPDIER